MLKYLNCHAHPASVSERQSEFNIAAYSACSLFLGKLPQPYSCGEINKCLVYLHEGNEKGDILSSEFTGNKHPAGVYKKTFFHNQTEDLVNVAIVHRRFDFAAWFAGDDTFKKKMLAEEVFEALCACADKFGWERGPLEAALKACAEAGYQNAWEVARLKSKTSPDKRQKASVFAEYGLYDFNIYALLIEGAQTAPRKLLIKRFDGLQKGGLYPENAHNALAGNTKWENGDFVLYGKDGMEVGRVKL